MKAHLNRHRKAVMLSWLWAIIGAFILIIASEYIYIPAYNLGSGSLSAKLAPLFLGAYIAHFVIAALMMIVRRLPHSNTYEILVSNALLVICCLLLGLAAGRCFYSSIYLLFFLAFELLWFGAEVFVRRRYTNYYFIVLPTNHELKAEDFPGYRIEFAYPADSVREIAPDAAVFDFSADLTPKIQENLLFCQNRNIPIIPLPMFLENVWGRIPLGFVNPGIILTYYPSYSYQAAKFVLDKLAAVLGLIVASPLLLVTAILVKVTSKGPILFKQERTGLQGKPYIIYKFRSMLEGMEKHGVSSTVKNDFRLTPIGPFIRRYHLDELPQLVNVLKGEMSLVGPRPGLPGLYEKEIPFYNFRTIIRPGVTSWAILHQGNVSGIEQTAIKLSYDLYYIKNASLFLDLYIIVKTIWIVVFGIETFVFPDSNWGEGCKPDGKTTGGVS